MTIDSSLVVLHVDDNVTMHRIVRTYLNQLGIRDIDHAQDGTAALVRLSTRRYGLVVSDWNMQPMTGFDLLRVVRENPALRDVPFILATSESKTANVMAARSAGVDGYLVKPFTVQALRLRIESVLAARPVALTA